VVCDGKGTQLTREQATQCLDVARLGGADVDERPDLTEVGSHLRALACDKSFSGVSSFDTA
jgi:hypothetical protein